MKYLLIELLEGDPWARARFKHFSILEEAMKAYESAKKTKGNIGVVLTAILKES